MIRQTSLEAYQMLERYEFGKLVLNDRRQKVLGVLRDSPFALSDKRISAVLGWPINCVTPRRGELVKMGLVCEAGMVSEGGRRVLTWKVKE